MPLNPPAGRSSLHDLTFSALEGEIVGAGHRAAHTRALWKALNRELVHDLSGREDFSPPLRRWTDEAVGEKGRFFAEAPTEAADIASADGLTRKFLLRLTDGQTIETVLMG